MSSVAADTKRSDEEYFERQKWIFLTDKKPYSLRYNRGGMNNKISIF